MKLQLEKLLTRVDALSLRERVFLFLSVIACLLALADLMWLAPAQAAHKQLVNQFTSQNAELSRLRAELRTLAQPSDAGSKFRNDMSDAQAKLAGLNEDISRLIPASDSGPGIESVLVELLRRQEGLTLLSVGTPKMDAPPVAGSDVEADAGLTRRGLELRVAGSYPDLIRYVRTLEGALPALRWGPMRLKGEAQPPELTLQVFAVGVQP